MNDKQRLIKLEADVKELTRIVFSLLPSPENMICECGHEKVVLYVKDGSGSHLCCVNPECSSKH